MWMYSCLTWPWMTGDGRFLDVERKMKIGRGKDDCVGVLNEIARRWIGTEERL